MSVADQLGITPGDVVSLDDERAGDPSLAGAKAANLAQAGAAGLPVVPGFVLTTQFDATRLAVARPAWSALSEGGRHAVVVRSSSTAEDGAASSMAGLFTSVLDVRGWDALTAAVAQVLGSRQRSGLANAPMAILVQRHLDPRWGGVLFGADPVTGRTDRFVVSAVRGGPDRLVSGLVDGWTATLTRRGRVADVTEAGPPRPDPAALRGLAGLARRVDAVFGGPQDVEWAIDADGSLRLLQSRPITTLHGPVAGPVLGPGPLAETFPEPLAPLEQDLWIVPVRDALGHALRLTGSVSVGALRRSPVVTVIDGRPVADLHLLGATSERLSIPRKFDPRPPARRLRASWRVGRLRRALPAIARDVVARVDADLEAIPGLDDMSNGDLFAVLHNGREYLRALHGQEALAGMLIPDGAESVTAASMALSALSEVRAEGASCGDLVERHPVVLALVSPHIGGEQPQPAVPPPTPSPTPPAERVDPHPMALARESLRLRVRWVQEATARAAWELGERLASVGVLPRAASVRLLTLDELREAARTRAVPPGWDERREPTGAPLPAELRLAADGTPVPVAAGRAGGAVAAGGGIRRGPVHLGDDPSPGAVLVVEHLDPRLAPVIPLIGGLVAETGSPLSHLAILAREYGVPTVVGVSGARDRFTEGQIVQVDGSSGAVVPVDAVDPVDSVPADAGPVGPVDPAGDEGDPDLASIGVTR
jgi:phosphohistidine swiveling domain-containing protein